MSRHREVEAALDLIERLVQRGQPIAITAKTAAELAAKGIVLPDAEIVSKIPRDTLVVCALLTSPLLRSDNVVRRCRECGERIQLRPHVPRRAAVACVPCALRMARGDA